jgi:outer membrane protein assembly factor BamA
MIRTLTAALLLIVASGALAEEAASPAYLVERIEVRNTRRVSKEVVIAESRLHPGNTYSEQDLRDAAARLTRLPFLLSADFALEKGTERGKHLLIITVGETKELFFSVDARPLLNDPGLQADYSDRLGMGPNHGTAGIRHFVGRRGAVHAAVSSSDLDREFFDNYSTVDVGYTQYDLFGTSAFATLNLRRTLGGRGTSDISPEFVAGIPVTPNQTLTFELARTTLAATAHQGIITSTDYTVETIRSEERQNLASVTWSYNTTNHPFLPTRGMVINVTPRTSWGQRDFRSTFTPEAPPEESSLDSRVHSLRIDAARYWELSARDSVSGKVMLGHSLIDWENSGTGDVEGHTGYASGEVGFSRTLFAPARAEDGDSRLEVSFRTSYISEDVDDPRVLPRHKREDTIPQISTSWVRRNAWGTLRLGVGYAW